MTNEANYKLAVRMNDRKETYVASILLDVSPAAIASQMNMLLAQLGVNAFVRAEEVAE